MRFGGLRRLTALTLGFGPAFALALALLALALLGGGPVRAEGGAGAAPAAETAPAPEAVAPAEPSEPKAAPGIPADAAAETVDVPSRPVALLAGDSDWGDGFKNILNAIAKVQDAAKTAGLKQAGPPFAVFLSTDDASFHFEAMVPLAEKPEGKSELGEDVKLGDSPSGKALKFLHRGAYDDIDSTYDLITAYLDEKGLDAKNLFIEEYLTPTKESDDAALETDIYVFLK